MLAQNKKADEEDFFFFQLKAVDQLNKLIKDAPDFVSDDIVAGCVYMQASNYPARDAIVANAHGTASDQNHKDFLANSIADAQIIERASSLIKSRKSKERFGVYPSAFRLDHLCANYVVCAEGPIIQIVVRSDITSKQKASLESYLKLVLPASDLVKNVQAAHKKFKNKIDKLINAQTPQPKQGFVVEFDVKGSTPFSSEVDFPNAERFLTYYQNSLLEIIQKYGAHATHLEGDGIRFLFPTTGMNDQKRHRLFHQTILPAVTEAQNFYKKFKNKSENHRLHKTFLKASASYGSQSFYMTNTHIFDFTQKGEVFSRVANMNKHGVYESDTLLLVDETVLPSLKNSQVKTRDTKFPRFHGLKEVCALTL